MPNMRACIAVVSGRLVLRMSGVVCTATSTSQLFPKHLSGPRQERIDRVYVPAQNFPDLRRGISFIIVQIYDIQKEDI